MDPRARTAHPGAPTAQVSSLSSPRRPTIASTSADCRERVHAVQLLRLPQLLDLARERDVLDGHLRSKLCDWITRVSQAPVVVATV